MRDDFNVKDFNARTGTATQVHDNESGFTIQKTYDAEPYLEFAKAERDITQGQSWGEGRKVGTIPPAVMATFLRQDGGFDVKRAEAWLRANPAFVSFEPFLRVKSKL